MKKFITFFVLLFSLFSSIAQGPMTIGTVYNFDIGDVFHTYREARIVFNSGDFWYKKEVISKEVSSNIDTFYYVFKVDEYTPPSSMHDPSWRHKEYNETLIITNLGNLIPYAHSTISDPSLFNGRDVTYADTAGFSAKYIEGCGGWYGTATNPPGYETISLLYFKKGSEDWGTKLYLGRDEIEQNSNTKIYPNPSHDITMIDFGNKILSGSITLFDSMGRLIMSEELRNKESISLDLRVYPRGVYSLSVQSEDYFETFNLILE